jgi:hypothetical protein
MISYDSTLTKFTITPGTTFSGSYTIQFDLCDPYGCNTYSFGVYVNKAPIWASSPSVSQNVKVGFTSTYTLPTYSDPDGDTITLDTVYTSAASFTTFDAALKKFTFAPTSSSEVGTYTINLSLVDADVSAGTTFTVTVEANGLPTFSTAPGP